MEKNRVTTLPSIRQEITDEQIASFNAEHEQWMERQAQIGAQLPAMTSFLEYVLAKVEESN